MNSIRAQVWVIFAALFLVAATIVYFNTYDDTGDGIDEPNATSKGAANSRIGSSEEASASLSEIAPVPSAGSTAVSPGVYPRKAVLEMTDDELEEFLEQEKKTLKKDLQKVFEQPSFDTSN